ncbi:MAG: hypothetical protein H8E31_05185 [Planctomycetes bacterium]|nr:hypothetical protein [Planctomycetota bacterium]
MLAVSGPTDPAAAAGLEASIETLTQAVLRFEQRMEGLDPPALGAAPAADRLPERRSLDRPTLDQLVLRLESLEQTLLTLAASVEGLAGISSIAGGVSPLSAATRYPTNVDALCGLRGKEDVELAIDFLGMNYRQVLERFGSPSSVQNFEGTVAFYYEDLPEGGEVSVEFRDERVVGFQSYWDE